MACSKVPVPALFENHSSPTRADLTSPRLREVVATVGHHPELIHRLERVPVPRPWMRDGAVEDAVMGGMDDCVLPHGVPADRAALEGHRVVGIETAGRGRTRDRPQGVVDPFEEMRGRRAPPRHVVLDHGDSVRRIGQNRACLIGAALGLLLAETGLEQVRQRLDGLPTVGV